MTDSIEDFIYKNRIKEQLDRLSEKYKDKRVLIYGTGKLFQKIKELYSFDNFNVVGVSDVKYYDLPELETEYNYKIYTPDKIVEAKPDIILCCLQQYSSVLPSLKFYLRNKNCNTKIFFISQNIKFCKFLMLNIAKYIHEIKKHLVQNIKKNNTVYIVDDFGIKTEYNKKIRGLNISFLCSGNTIILHKDSLSKFKNTSIVCKNNCSFSIKRPAKYISNSEFYLSSDNNVFEAGANFYCIGAKICLTFEPNLSLRIGSNCMFAEKLYIRTSDAHTVYDMSTGRIINKGQDINIGNNVWLGYNTTILKGAVIPDNTIVASNSLVNKPFQESNTILAGIPAKVVKTGVNWDVKQPSLFSDFYE